MWKPTYIFYKELKIDENNVFTVNTLEKNEVENVIFKKNQEYPITGMAIKPDIVESDIVKVTDQKKTWRFKQKDTRTSWKKKKNRLRDLKIVNPETKPVTIPPSIKLVFHNTKTENNEDILFYNYYEHLQKIGFEWENMAIDFKFSLKLSKDEKSFIKNDNEQKN